MRWVGLLLVLVCAGLAWLYFSTGSVEVREVPEEEAPAAAEAPAPKRATDTAPSAGSRVPEPLPPPPLRVSPATVTSTPTSTSTSASTASTPTSLTEARARSSDEQSALLTIKDDHGNPRLVTREDAIKACETLGGYVATMRQWAEHGGRKGAFGILEVKEVVSGNVEPPLTYSVDGSEEMTYYLVRAVDADGKKDQFYYNPRGYRPSTHALGRLLFHTSSVDSKGRAFTFGLNGANGVLGGQQGGANGEGPQLAYASCWKREK